MSFQPSPPGESGAGRPPDDGPGSPIALLGEFIRDNAAHPAETATGLRALVICAAEDARMRGIALADFVAALERTVARDAAAVDDATRERLRFAVLHWGKLAHADADDPLTHGRNKYES